MKTIEDLRKEIAEYHKQYGQLKEDYRIALKNTIKAILTKYGGKVDFTEDEDFRDEYRCCIGSVCVSYDGGNHPEYASNAYSEVYDVKLNEDDILIGCDDCDEYDIERVWSLDEVESLCDALEFYDDYKKDVKKAE